MQVIALLRGKTEEQIQEQKEEINLFCATKGFDPQFTEFTDIAEIDFDALIDKTIIFSDLSRISRDTYVLLEFLNKIKLNQLQVYLANHGYQLTPELITDPYFYFYSFNLLEREKNRERSREYWTPERRSEHSDRMKKVWEGKKQAHTP